MSDINKRALDRRQLFLLILIVILVLALMCVTFTLLVIHASKPEEDDIDMRTNILFIIVDDLRPVLGCYGDKIAVTPNIDSLASRSILFKNVYAQQALDGPSRISLMTSRRPDTLHLYDNGSYWRETVGDFVTLPQHFKNHGYETISVGKLFEHGKTSNGTDDFPHSWSENPYWPKSQENEMEPECNSSDGHYHLNLICPVNVDSLDGTLPDIEITEYAMEYLKTRLKYPNKTEPFFLGVGYHKPHIPFKIPEDYFNLYENVDFATNSTALLTKIPRISWNPWTDIREMEDVKALNVSFPYGPLPEEFQKLIRQGYYASVSYIDDQIGKLLQALEDTGFAESTTVVLLADHGWALGEHKEWSKYSNFEVALQVPLIIYIPGFTDDEDRKPHKYISVLDMISLNNIPEPENLTMYQSVSQTGYVSNELVELVDVFPTLTEIADLPEPPLCEVNMTDFCSEGISLYPVMQHIILEQYIHLFTWKTAAFSQYPRPTLSPQNNSDQPALKDIDIMGYSIRTDTYRYTEWVAFDNEIFKPDWPLIISRELYDHSVDSHEETNLCDEDQYSNTVIALSRRIKKGWRNELPPGSV